MQEYEGQTLILLWMAPQRPAPMRRWVPQQLRPPQQRPALGNLPLPFQVFQQEEEGDEVGVGQRAEQVHHAVFLGSRV